MDQLSNESLQQGRKVMESDLDLEFNFDFKPVTKGLGFHQKERPVTPSKTAYRTNAKPISSPQKVLSEADIFGEKELSSFERELLFGAKPKETQKPLPKKEIFVEADPFLQIGAFAVDVAIMATLLVVTLSLFVVVSPFSLKEASILISNKTNWIFAGVLAVIFFLTYFSFLEVGVTPGKALFKMGTVSKSGKGLSLVGAFIRSLITLLSFLALGVPLLFDFQGKLSDSIVVKR